MPWNKDPLNEHLRRLAKGMQQSEKPITASTKPTILQGKLGETQLDRIHNDKVLNHIIWLDEQFDEQNQYGSEGLTKLFVADPAAFYVAVDYTGRALYYLDIFAITQDYTNSLRAQRQTLALPSPNELAKKVVPRSLWHSMSHVNLYIDAIVGKPLPSNFLPGKELKALLRHVLADLSQSHYSNVFVAESLTIVVQDKCEIPVQDDHGNLPGARLAKMCGLRYQRICGQENGFGRYLYSLPAGFLNQFSVSTVALSLLQAFHFVGSHGMTASESLHVYHCANELAKLTGHGLSDSTI